MFIRLLMATGLLVTLIFIVTQVIIPLWFSRPILSMFRGKRRALESDLARAQEAVDQRELKTRIKELKQQAR